MIIISVNPNSRNRRPVTAYWMPITLWSTENTYLRQNPSSSWAWSCACPWGAPVTVFSNVGLLLAVGCGRIVTRIRNGQLYAEGTRSRKRRTAGSRGVRSQSVAGSHHRWLRRASTVAAMAAAVAIARPAFASSESRTLRARGASEIYNLDRERALE